MKRKRIWCLLIFLFLLFAGGTVLLCYQWRYPPVAALLQVLDWFGG